MQLIHSKETSQLSEVWALWVYQASIMIVLHIKVETFSQTHPYMNVSPVPPPCLEQDFPLEEATGRAWVRLVFLSPQSQLFPLPMRWAAVLVQKHSPKPDVWRWPPLSCRGLAEGTTSAETSHFQGDAQMDHLGGKIYKQTKGTWMTMAK